MKAFLRPGLAVLLAVAGASSLSAQGEGYFWQKPGVLGSQAERQSERMAARSPRIETRQAFSFEPAEFRAGDRVTARSDTRLMIGRETVGTVNRGQAFEVTAVQGPWLGTHVEINGRMVGGWVHFENVTADR
jgi:hypothetical protein